MKNEWIDKNDKSKGGFFDLPKQKICRHPEHEPPRHMVIPQGKGYKHICPECGRETIVIPPQLSLNVEQKREQVRRGDPSLVRYVNPRKEKN